MRSSILLKKFLIWTTKYAQTSNWFFISCVNEWCSHMTFDIKKLFSHIVQNITKSLYTTFERFLMTASSARSNLANCSLKKNLTSNGCKPIRVLTCTKSSCSDGHLPIGYSLPDFQPHRSNFFAHPPPPPPPTQPGRKGVDTLGGLRPPKPPRGDRVNISLTQTEA